MPYYNRRNTIYRNETSGKEVGIEPMNKGLESLKLVEDKIKSTMQGSRRKEKEEPKSTRGLDDYWQDFSDSEEELEALELLAKAEEEVMLEYEQRKEMPGQSGMMMESMGMGKKQPSLPE